MDRQAARVARSRALVTDAVIDLIVEGGLSAVTVDAVVARSGVAKTTVYRHWASREALLADVLASALPAQAAPDTGSLDGDLRALARGLAGGLGNPRTAALLGAIAFPDGDRALDDIRARATRDRHTVVRAVLQRARRRGEPIPARRRRRGDPLDRRTLVLPALRRRRPPDPHAGRPLRGPSPEQPGDHHDHQHNRHHPGDRAMSARPVLVTGALGNVGGATTTALLALGDTVRAGDLDPAAITARFPDAEPVRLDFLDPATFRPALTGCRALFLLRPPPISRVKPTLNRLLDVATEVGIEHVVFSSVEGADTNKIVPHHRVETHLQASGLPYTILRPGFFAQNLTDAYRLDIRDDHRLYVPAADGRVAFIDVTDLGEVAATVFADPSAHLGLGYTLTGPQALTFTHVADLLTAALGRPIRYQPATALGYLQHLHHRGLPVAAIAVQTILHLGLRRGDAENISPTFDTLLGRPATPLVDFITRNADRWQTL